MFARLSCLHTHRRAFVNRRRPRYVEGAFGTATSEKQWPLVICAALTIVIK
jgi:hypothetical protein